MSTKHKETIDRFLEDVKKTCHAMIDKQHVCESPIALAREAINYMEEYHKEKKQERTKDETKPGQFS